VTSNDLDGVRARDPCSSTTIFKARHVLRHWDTISLQFMGKQTVVLDNGGSSIKAGVLSKGRNGHAGAKSARWVNAGSGRV